MRIACIYLPSFPLQTALVAAVDGFDIQTRPVAVVTQPAVGPPLVVECSRLARAAGVRPTMTASAAQALVANLQCLVADAAAEQSLLRAVADSLLAITPRIDLGGEPRGLHHCIYVEVPAGRRGAWFGSRLLERLAVFGLRGRVGIADDRFTAYVAASTSEDDDSCLIESRSPHRDPNTICVPRGGSAVFLDDHGGIGERHVESNITTASVAEAFHVRELTPIEARSTPGLFDWSAEHGERAERGERPEHRRTRRGKQRPRIALGQARLFSGE
jgi:hypothetical protein